MENSKYSKIKSKYFAEALAFLGFTYFKFNEGEEVYYCFENTYNFRSALAKLIQLKNEYRK